MKISPDNPHLQKFKTAIYHERHDPIDFPLNSKNARQTNMSPREYRKKVEELPFLPHDEQVAFILRWRAN